MQQTIYIPFTLPGLNEIIAAAKSGHGRGNAYSRIKKKVMVNICWVIKRSKLQPVTACNLSFLWIEKDRRRDPDNICTGKKIILDSLVEMGILQNDGWKQVKGFSDTWDVDAKAPGVMVTLVSSL